MIILALDPGLKRTGFCLSDSTSSIPFSSGVIKGEIDRQIEKIIEIINQHNVGKIICGYPLSLSGRKTRQTEMIDEFIDLLEQKTGLVVERIDERLSSEEAKKIMKEMGKKQKQKELVDEIAARLLLDTYLRSKKGIE